MELAQAQKEQFVEASTERALVSQAKRVADGVMVFVVRVVVLRVQACAEPEGRAWT